METISQNVVGVSRMAPEKPKFISGMPVRRIPRSRVAMRGALSVHGKFVQHESGLERDFLILLNFDPSVAEVVGQPVKIMFRRPGETRQWPYYPDFYVRYAGPDEREVLYQIKYDNELRQAFHHMKPAWRQAMRVAREHGMTHRILTERRIRGDGHYLTNAGFLARCLHTEPDAEIEERIAATLATIGPCTPDTLLKGLFWASENRAMAIPHLWRMIAQGRIVADLTRPLTMASPITIIVGEGYKWTDPYSRR